MIVGEVRVKFNSKVTSMGAWRDRYATKSDRGVRDFGALLRGSDKKKFSFSRVDS